MSTRIGRAVVAVSAITALALPAMPARAVPPTAPELLVAFENFSYDRVTPGEDAAAMEPDGQADALFSVYLASPGLHSVTFASFGGGSHLWNTAPDGNWIAAATAEGAGNAFLNQPDADIDYFFADAARLWFYLAPGLTGIEQGMALDVQVCIDSTNCATARAYTPSDTDADLDGYTPPEDCDDANDAIHPGQYDTADNGIDDDCDGFDAHTFYFDNDGDGYGGSASYNDNAPDPGWVAYSGDCNDNNGNVHPGATEVADDGTDQDCDGADVHQFWADADGDLYGDPAQPALSNDYPAPAGLTDNDDDCDDGDANVHPGATEVAYDGTDQDCDGVDASIWYLDADLDGYGNDGQAITSPEAPRGHIQQGGDCDDGNDTIHPGATEVADDGTDQDCDGADVHQYWGDADGDLYGDPAQPALSNDYPPQASLTDNDGDCDDGDDTVHPGATEIADDGTDQDCDGADLRTWYADADADGYGDPASSSTANDAPEGTVAGGTDCNDSDHSVHPGATEVADDGVDQDCDGGDLRTWFADADADAYGDPAATAQANDAPEGHVADATDCDDSSSAVHPGATEIADDGVDQDCDSFDLRTWHADADADGFGDPAVTVQANDGPADHVADATDCDDSSSAVHPGASEVADDGVDQDCDSFDLRTFYADTDIDGYGDPASPTTDNTQPTGYAADATDCDDSSSAVHPGATEIADDGVDQDCDSFDLRTWFADADADGFGDPAVTVQANDGPADHVADATDCDDSSSDVNPDATEIPNDGVDQDCDGVDLVSNLAPTADSQTVNINEDTSVVVTLSASDPDDDALTFSLVGSPTHGTLGPLSAPDCTATNVCTATIRYTPAPNYNGPDSFAFNVADPGGFTPTRPAAITIEVAAVADTTTLSPGAKPSGYFTLQGTKAVLSTLVSSTDPACVTGRPVTFSVTGGSLTSPAVFVGTATKQGQASVQFTLAPGTYSAALSTPATGGCASASASTGSFVIASNKKVR